MKIKLLSAIFLFLIATLVKAQVNLVPNPSFESYVSCPNTFSQINFTGNWYRATWGTPDYFNACDSLSGYLAVPGNFAGYHTAFNNGKAYAGLITYDTTTTNYREYIQVALDSVLTSGSMYYLSFHVSLSSGAALASDGLGAYLSPTAVSGPTYNVLNFVPQVSSTPGLPITQSGSWTMIQGLFLATGGEKYLTIGSFIDDATITIQRLYQDTGQYMENKTYYYIDQVCLSRSAETCGVDRPVAVGINSHPVSDASFFYYDPQADAIVVRNIPTSCSVKISDSQGNTIKMLKMDREGELDVSDLENGLYVVQVRSVTANSIKKIIIAK